MPVVMSLPRETTNHYLVEAPSRFWEDSSGLLFFETVV